MYCKNISVAILICNIYNVYCAQVNDIEIYKPYYLKAYNTNNLSDHLYQPTHNALHNNSLQLIYNRSQITIVSSSNSYSYTSILGSINSINQTNNLQSVDSNSESSNSQTSDILDITTHRIHQPITSQNDISNFYYTVDNMHTSSNNNRIVFNTNLTDRIQNNVSYSNVNSDEQQNTNLIHLNINVNRSID